MCVLCNANSSNPNEVVLFEDTDVVAAIAFGQKRRNLGCVLVIPKSHYEDLYHIPDEILSKVQILAKKVSIALKKGLNCDGISIRQNNEKAGDQDVFHYHVHVIPRFDGDNFRDAEMILASLEERKSVGDKIKKYLTSRST